LPDRTNPVESPFAAVRLRTDAARRYKKVANAEALIWKGLMIAEKKFRRLNSPELLDERFGTAKVGTPLAASSNLRNLLI
jgi:hypothetical protein